MAVLLALGIWLELNVVWALACYIRGERDEQNARLHQRH